MNDAAFSLRDDWMVPGGSELADAVNGQFEILLILGLSLLFAGLFVASYVALNQEKRSDGPARPVPVAGGVLAGAFGAVLAGFLFFGGLDVFVQAQVPPARARQVEAVADSTGWRFVYSADVASDVLHVSTEEATALTLTSPRGVTRFSVPALRVAETVWPDATASTWFHASVPGEYALRATGVSTAPLDSTTPRVVVHDGPGFDAWLASVSNVLDRYPPLEAGEILVQRNGCLVCHSTDGSPNTAPSFLGLFARTRTLVDGATVRADSVYVLESILEPQAQVVQGFQPVMPSFRGKLNELEIAAIAVWIDSLDDATQEEGR